jgi:hypothetical protein
MSAAAFMVRLGVKWTRPWLPTRTTRPNFGRRRNPKRLTSASISTKRVDAAPTARRLISVSSGPIVRCCVRPRTYLLTLDRSQHVNLQSRHRLCRETTYVGVGRWGAVGMTCQGRRFAPLPRGERREMSQSVGPGTVDADRWRFRALAPANQTPLQPAMSESLSQALSKLRLGSRRARSPHRLGWRRRHVHWAEDKNRPLPE